MIEPRKEIQNPEGCRTILVLILVLISVEYLSCSKSLVGPTLGKTQKRPCGHIAFLTPSFRAALETQMNH